MGRLVQKVEWNLDGTQTQMYMYGEADFESNKAMQEPLEKLYQYEMQNIGTIKNGNDKQLKEREWNMIEYSLKFLHNRDLSLFYKKEFIAVLENIMKKLNIDFVPQSEIDKNKVEEYIIRYKDISINIFLNTNDETFTMNYIENKIKDIIRKNNIQQNSVKILMNKSTFDKFSNFCITMRYIKVFLNYPVLIKDCCDNGEIWIESEV